MSLFLAEIKNVCSLKRTHTKSYSYLLNICIMFQVCLPLDDVHDLVPNGQCSFGIICKEGAGGRGKCEKKTSQKCDNDVDAVKNYNGNVNCLGGVRVYVCLCVFVCSRLKNCKCILNMNEMYFLLLLLLFYFFVFIFLLFSLFFSLFKLCLEQ